MGAALAPATLSVIMSGCKNSPDTSSRITEEEQHIITEVADIIIPETSTPGAREAGVGPFIVMMINECYPPEVRVAFKKGIHELNEHADTNFEDHFLSIGRNAQESLIETISKQPVDKEKGPSFFKLMKDLTVLGYFTSEIGATKALDYVAVPTKYDGCVDMSSSKKTWAL